MCTKSLCCSFFIQIVARPLKVHASNEEEDVVGFEGANISLQSSLRIHALNSVQVSWFKIVGNSHQLVPRRANKDYSLTLTNLTEDDAGTYYATVTSNEHEDWSRNGTLVTLSIVPQGPGKLCMHARQSQEYSVNVGLVKVEH